MVTVHGIDYALEIGAVYCYDNNEAENLDTCYAYVVVSHYTI